MNCENNRKGWKAMSALSFAKSACRTQGGRRFPSAGALVVAGAVVLAASDARSQAPWPADQFNPAASAGDVILPMPCGGSMAFRQVPVPASNALDDRRVQLGGTDSRYAYAENSRVEHIGAGFTDTQRRNQSYYLIGKYEVTRVQYEAMVGKCVGPSTEGRLPKTGVTWSEAVFATGAYTAWLAKNGKGKVPSEEGQPALVRLPTESEWEFAARGGVAVDATQFELPAFPMPEGRARYVWHAGTESSNNELNVIGLLKPNPIGIHDILGNAGEFVLDPFRLNKHSRLHGQAGAYMVKGGDFRTPAGDIRASARVEYVPVDQSGERRDQATGFRVVVVPPSLPSAARLQSLRTQWSNLAQTASAQQQPLADPIREIEALAKAVNDPALRSRVEGVGVTMRANIQARNEQRDRSARSEVRVAAYLGKKILEDRAKVRALEAIVAGPLSEEMKAGPRQNLRQSVQAVEATLDYLVETIRQIGREYPREVVSAQAEILKREFEARKAAAEFQPLVDGLTSASQAVASGKPLDRAALLAILTRLEKR